MNTVHLIADDLTGALDGAAPFAGGGWSTALCLPRSTTSNHVPEPAVRVASTDSRRLHPEQASARMALHLQQHVPVPGALLVKKIDSLLRGPYAAELRVLMQATRRTTAIICPALPRMQRHLVDGRLWSDGREVPHGERIAGEASSALEQALTTAFPDWSLERRDARALTSEPVDGLVVVDARSEADLDHLVDRFWGKRTDVVWVGSSGLTQALARRLTGNSPVPDTTPLRRPCHPMVLVIGSRTDRTQAEIRALLDSAPWTLTRSAAKGPAVRRATLGGITLLMSPDEDMSCDDATQMLSVAALRAIEAGAHDVAVVGGETLAALVERLAPSDVRILGPAAAGFEAMVLQSDTTRCEIRLFSRSGGFGEPGDLWSLCAPFDRECPT